MPIGIDASVAPASTRFSSPTQDASERISSGSRINSARDDASGLAIAERLGREIDGLSVSIRNAGDGISLTQVASGGLDNLREDFTRLRELSLQSANGALNDSDRQALQEEADQIQDNIRQTLEDTTFNGRDLLRSDEPVTLQTGTNAGDTVTLETDNLEQNLRELGGLSLRISDQQSAEQAITAIDESLDRINLLDAEFGAVANRLESGIEQAQQQQENTAGSRSRIADADIAAEASRLAAADIQDQARLAVRAQANAQSESVLRLLS